MIDEISVGSIHVLIRNVVSCTTSRIENYRCQMEVTKIVSRASWLQFLFEMGNDSYDLHVDPSFSIAREK